MTDIGSFRSTPRYDEPLDPLKGRYIDTEKLNDYLAEHGPQPLHEVVNKLDRFLIPETETP